MVTLVNRAKVSTSTTGTGTITLGSAVDGYQTFADAGVTDGDTVRYVIEDGSAWEVGYGTYTASGTTLTRNVMESSNSDAAISLSGSATVFVGAAAEDVSRLVNVATVGSTSTIDLSSGTFFRIADVVGDRTFALSNIPSSGAYSGLIEIPYYFGTITWPSEFDWEGGSAPTIPANSDYLISITRADITRANVIKAQAIGPFTSTGEVTYPTFVGYASNSSQGNNDTVISLTGLTGGSASSPSEGDIVVVCCHVSDNSNVPTMGTAGYTTAASGDVSDTYNSALLVAYKVMGATPDTSVTVNGNANLNDAQTAIAFVFSGVDTTTPLDVTPTVAEVQNTVLADPPSITTGTSGRGGVLLGIGGGAHINGVQTYSDTAGEYNTFFSLGFDDSTDSTLGIGYTGVILDGSTYDPSAFGFSSGDATSYSNVAATVVLRGAT